MGRLNLFNWITGRQNSGYSILPIIRKGFPLGRILGFDLYIIRYNDGGYIPPHTDPVKEGSHYRLNFVLKKSKSGGEFYCQKYSQFWRFVLFRPDLYLHEVSRCCGTRYVISFGVCINGIS
jgi:hypothetical protein